MNHDEIRQGLGASAIAGMDVMSNEVIDILGELVPIANRLVVALYDSGADQSMIRQLLTGIALRAAEM